MPQQARPPSLIQALVPVLALIGLLALSVYLFGDGSSAGPNQIALVLSAGVGIVIGLANGYTWRELEQGIVQGISLAMGAILILLVVGALIGAWILGGIVPTMIYYGLSLLTPSVFYAAACAICGVVALGTGSSWTTAGTVGVALIGIATAQDLHLGLAAGSVISGAYFGDKLSPLSDTTNLAPAIAGTDLFTHVRHLLWTTIPSIVLALVLFGLAGLTMTPPRDTHALEAITAALSTRFVIGWHMLLPVVFVLLLVLRRMPAFPALLLGSLVGCAFAVVFQPDTVLAFVNQPELPRSLALLKGAWISLFDGFRLQSGHEALDSLLSRGGMSSMLSTVWLILSAMLFGAVMETTGMLQRIASGILSAVRGTGSLVAATIGTSFATNVLASDQYMAIVLPGRMFRSEYARRGLHPKNLSRSLEDAGTVTSVLVPWNTCGAFMAQTLGVSTFAYAPFAFFNLLSPLVALVYAATGLTIERLPDASDELVAVPRRAAGSPSS